MNPYFSTNDPHGLFDVHELFAYYNTYFFSGILQKCVVKWTNRMTLCAGTCKYQGSGSSTIALSEPILKFRNSNEVKETLLHQMIHAFLFITDPQSCKVDQGHGPKFKQIMHNINSISGLNLSVYHNFHDEVASYRQHIWRCNGVCKDSPPYFGYVKRAVNRKPQPADSWFKDHLFKCGGQFIKIKSPQKNNKPKSKSKSLDRQSIQHKQKEIKQIKLRKKKQSKKQNWGGSGKTIADYLKQMSTSKQKINQN